MESNAKAFGFGIIGLVLGIAVGLGVARIFVPPGNDPPVIIHGGSMHLGVIADAQVDPGNPILVSATDLTTLGLNGYVDSSGNSVSTVALNSNWEVDVCDDKPAGVPAKCINGWTLCSTSNCSTSVTVSSGGTITITTLGGNQTMQPGMPTQFKRQHRYKFYDSTGKNAGNFHPGWIQIVQSSGTTTLSCGADPSQTTDWSACWLAMGSPPATLKAVTSND